jgi:arsenate reductase
VNPVAVEALRELGIEIGGALPRKLETEAVQVADVVITMGCGDACPVFPGKRYEDWDVEDPAGKDLETVRRIRDDIDARVRALVETL